ncbi:MAG: hypothetical protein K9L78_05635 [Victivallales bacterium]|nr:hypothetical protein [Victivallales bacterium]MCF7889584.1 hypothetical protein [Victivallales bacterium]
MKRDTQITGNIGMYYICYKLSKLGWNVMPTARNAKGVDIIAYNRNCSKFISIQVKTLSKRNPVPLGSSLEKVMGDYWIIVNDVVNTPNVFILLPDEIKEKAHRGEKKGKVSYWLQPKSYETEQFKDAWNRIGEIE